MFLILLINGEYPPAAVEAVQKYKKIPNFN